MAPETAPDTVLDPTVHSGSDAAEGPHPGEVIVTQGLWKTYEMGDQEVNALCGVNLRVRHNEYVAIMGPSGSGKSTQIGRASCRERV